MQESKCFDIQIFPILGEPATPIEPSNRAFDDPTFWEDDETLGPIGTFDDFDVELGQDFANGLVKDRALVGAVGEQLLQERKQAKQRAQQKNASVAILNVGGMHDGMQQQSLGVDENVPLLALDQLAGVEPGWIDAGPPFSALFTL